ncbi:MAG: ABC transporter permease [Candidatus Aegiribacteria sp.]
MFRDSLIILSKELKRIFTDRRMILFLVVVPLVMLPAMYSIMARMDEAKDSDIASYRSTISLMEGTGNREVSGMFIEALSALNTSVEIVDSHQLQSVKSSIAEREKELLVVLPDSMVSYLESSSTFDVSIYYNSASDYSQYTFEKVREALTSLSDDIVRRRLADRGISDEVLSVLTVNEAPAQYDLAPEGSVIGKIIGVLLPFFILIYLFANSMKVGLDSVAGEKERGTLAILLVNQVDRLAIVIGKMLSVMVAAIVGAASSVIGLIIASRYFMSMFGGTGEAMSSYSMSTLGIIQFTAVTIPLAVLVASMVLIVSTYARNTKEGQGMIMPVYFIVMIMGISTMQTGDVAPGWMTSTPIFNSLIALKSVFMNDASWGTVLTASLSSAVLAGILIYLTLRLFSSEKILFRI